MASPLGVGTFAEFGNDYEVDITAQSQCVERLAEIGFASPDILTARQFVTVQTFTPIKAFKGISGIKDSDW